VALRELRPIGNPLLASDVEAAIHLAEAAARSAVANVRANVSLMSAESAAFIEKQLPSLLPAESDLTEGGSGPEFARIRVVEGVWQDWGTPQGPRPHVSWRCPQCGQLHDTDVSVSATSPEVFSCELSETPVHFVVHWKPPGASPQATSPKG
jgi:hypothetical protein